jgi:threonine/homoserine/homoserine lactone efflux protein
VNSVLGDVLPLALVIAISPIPIIAAILMLLSPKARSTSVGFLVGWVLGVILAVVAFTLVSALLPSSDDGASAPITGVIQIVLGALLVVLAVRHWRSRPRTGQEPPLPQWMAAINSMTPMRGLLLGFALSGLNPKNLLMGIAAGVSIGSGGLTLGETSLTILIYTLIAASTVAIPVIAYLVAAPRMAGPLDELRTWLLHNNATVMAILLLVIGVVLIGKGIGSF